MKLLKKILNHTYRPLVGRFLEADREYRYRSINIAVRMGVFHPGFFFSTKFLLGEIEKQVLKGKTLLELGCGSGLISIVAAKNGASVTASDISSIAVACAFENSLRNNVPVTVIASDLFEHIPVFSFDYIIINPPYYRGKANSEAEVAWYCGEHLDYFEKLFGQIKEFMSSETVVLMVLSEDCETDEIKRMARKYGFELILRKSRRFWAERNFIFTIKAIGN